MSSVFNRWKRPYKSHRKSLVPEVNDKKLCDVFSLFIRLRDSDADGVAKCFTCNRRAHYKKMHCGHGVPRHYLATKFNEKNNNIQCRTCNGPEGGAREVYKAEMDKLYGQGTWDLMILNSRKVVHWSQFEVDQMVIFYKQEVKKLMGTKNFSL